VCYRGQSPGSGNDPGAQLLRAFGPALQILGALHSRPGPCPIRGNVRRRVLQHGHQASGLFLAGGQQIG